VKTNGPGQSALLLLDAVAVLTAEQIDYAVIGAVAASLHGVVRASFDADAIVSVTLQRLRELEKTFVAAGFQTDLRRGDAEDPIPALLALTDAHGNRVDLLGGLRGLETAAFARTLEVPFQGQTLRVIGLADFIAMKVFAGGPQDLVDARRTIAVIGEALDANLVRRLASRYGRTASETLEKLLSEHSHSA
jgi:hypothetical protein